MEMQDYFQNQVGDTLTRIQHNEDGAMFQVIGPDAVTKDIFFVTKVEPKTDEYGKKLHLVGGGDWEQKGKYFKGKDNAMNYFAKLSPESENDKYYNSKF